LLTYDAGIQQFKLMAGGQIIFKFALSQIKGYDQAIGGLIMKKQTVRIGVGSSDGNEYVLSFETPDLYSYDRLVFAVRTVQDEQAMSADLSRLIRSRERVPLSDVCSILARHNRPSGIEVAKKWLEDLIASGVFEGVIREDEFVSSAAMQKETVSYNVAASFDFKDGVLQIKCPKCGAAIPLTSKNPSGKCQFCGATYAVPAKILGLI